MMKIIMINNNSHDVIIRLIKNTKIKYFLLPGLVMETNGLAQKKKQQQQQQKKQLLFLN